jgi:hypothetical protein
MLYSNSSITGSQTHTHTHTPPKVSLDLQRYLVVVIAVVAFVVVDVVVVVVILADVVVPTFFVRRYHTRVLSLLLNQYFGVVVEFMDARCAVIVVTVLIKISQR